MSRLKTSLPESLAATVKTTIADWQSGGKMKRLWDRDASLWTGDDEVEVAGLARHCRRANRPSGRTTDKLAKEVHQRGFEHILLLGMGGSSLCPGSPADDFRQDSTVSRTCTCSIRPTRRR